MHALFLSQMFPCAQTARHILVIVQASAAAADACVLRPCQEQWFAFQRVASSCE